jgi:hypothetical protein
LVSLTEALLPIRGPSCPSSVTTAAFVMSLGDVVVLVMKPTT